MGVLPKEVEATYEVIAKMGEGGMGAVYKVRHRFFDEIRVVKVMQPDLAGLDDLKERFLGEAKRGKQLRHPNLAEVIDFSISEDGTYYIVMEYIEGTNLRDLVFQNNGPLDYTTVVEIAEQALSALGYLHSKRFVHRDISPDNLMVTRERTVKLIDLGIAKSLESTRALTMVGKFIGKVKYAAPEQFSGRTEPRSDLYALGVVLYELLTGRLPIKGDNQMSLVAGHVSHPPRPFTETDPTGRVPPGIRAAVMKALEKKPENRYQNAAAFSEALRAAMPTRERPLPYAPEVTLEVDVPTEPATAVEPTVPDTKTIVPSRKPWLIAIAALVGSIAIVNVIALWKREPAPVSQPAVVKPVPSSTTIEVVEPTPPVVETGRLLINALPWGQVTSVTDSAGVERLTGGASETPLLLSLQAGAYKVRLTNPNTKRTVVLDATVPANALAKLETELDRVDVNAYLDAAGVGE